MKLVDTLPFDLLEIVAELEISNKKYVPLKPIQAGSEFPHFVLKKQNLNRGSFLRTCGTTASVMLRQIKGKPLVISFYSLAWKEYGLAYLRYLNLLHDQINASGGSLLIFSPDEPNTGLEEVIWNNSLRLNFYFDKDNQIAQKFGLYSEADPAWNKYPGIEVNVPLLATYVINQSDRVVFDYIDNRLDGPKFSEELLQAIQISYLVGTDKQSA